MKLGHILLASVLLLTACDSMPTWLGGKDEKTKLAGKRIEVLADTQFVKADESLANLPVVASEAKANDNWQQAAGSQQGLTGNLQFSGFLHHDNTKIGDGNDWEQPLYSNIIIAGGAVFAMDARGYISAHDIKDIDKVLWKNTSALTKDEDDLLGGGLAYDNGHLYVTTGRGKAFAIDASNGKEIWTTTIGVPLRAAPKVGSGKLYAVSVDNQLFALDMKTGKQVWNHRGINENAGFLTAISPAINDNIVIAPYSSGEIHALDSATGQEIWSDSLLKPSRTSATNSFFGIAGTPIISDDAVFVAGSGGVVAAFSLSNGRRLWEQDISSSLNNLWLDNGFIYMISSENQLLCLSKSDGRVRWTKQLARYEDEEKRRHPYSWFGPIMANGQLLVAETKGSLLAISPKDGATIETIDIPSDLANAPIIAGGKLYFLTQNAKLHYFY